MAKSKPPQDRAPAAPIAAEEPAYTVVARRYRPQQFADLIGQEHVAGALVNALQSGRVAHAYLFTGARGVGKTSAARILAKALNCESTNKPTPTPCDTCASCLAIAAGDDVDVLEIDGASNNKVDEIRDLRQGVGFRPTHGRYKVYIIDEVHMLSTSAFNALLKTLEEPPEHVKFILATTEAQKIPITILSRCQRFDFAHVGPVKIFEQLKRIVEREGHQADEDALRLIARRAAGSMRDSQSLLDQLLASSPGRLTAEHVAMVLGTAGEDRVIELATAILAADAKTALELIGTWVERGLQVNELVDQLVEYWRALMLLNCGGAEVRELPATPNQHAALVKQAKETTLNTILAGLEVLTATKTRMRGSSHVQVLLEMAVVRLASLGELHSVGALIESLRDGAELPAAAPGKSAGGRTASHSAENRLPAPAPGVKPDRQSPPDAGNATGNLTESTLEATWEQCVRHLEEKSPILANHLKFSSSHAIFGPNALAIRFPVRYNQHCDACAEEVSLQRIREALQRVTGQTITVRCEIDRGAASPESASTNGATAMRSLADRKTTLQKLPLLKKASESLGAQIWHVDDEFNPIAPPRPDKPGAGDGSGPAPEEGDRDV